MTRTALVLGGGGITGIAWEIGILKGLADAGLDLTGTDIVIGTSAGSVVGAEVTGGRGLDAIDAQQLTPADAEIGGSFGLSVMVHLGALTVIPGSRRSKRRRIWPDA
jgi:NTE family protein